MSNNWNRLKKIDCSNGIKAVESSVCEWIESGTSFRIVNIKPGACAFTARHLERLIDRPGRTCRIRTANRGWLIFLLLVLLWPIGLAALLLVLIQNLVTADAEYVVIKRLFGAGIVVQHVKRKTGERIKGKSDKELVSDLPEEDLPFVSSDEIFQGDKVDVGNAITYFAQIRKRYGVASEVWSPIRERLIHIKKRQADSTLYVGVIGEASAGKSTFINAVLGIEFLKEDTCLGTTAASTILRHGAELSVTVRYLDGHSEVIDAKQLGIKIGKKPNWTDRLLETVHKYTAVESEACKIDCVEISLPIENELLESGVAIVDTPGINSENVRHNEVTTRAIKEICDIALILVPANVPLSACLSQYVKDNLFDVLGRCVLVMTQADKLREKERKAQLKYIVSRLKSATGGNVAGSYATSAYYVLDREDYGKASGDEVTKYREEFYEMLRAVKADVVKGKSAAIMEKMLIFLNVSLVPLLREMIGDKKKEFIARKESLEKSQLVDIDKYISHEQEKRSKVFSGIVVKDDKVIEEITKVQQSFLENMSGRIFGVEDRDGLKEVMEESAIRSELNDLQDPFKAALRGLCKPFRSKLASTMESFHADFAEAYKKLQSVSRKESLMSVSKVAEHDLSVNVSIDNFGEAMDSQLGADAMKSLGGAGAGAVIGSFICPGLGTVIGGVLGGVFGALFGKSLDTLKQEAYGSIVGIADDWLTQMIPQANLYIDGYRKSCEEKVKSNIAAYKEQYGAKILKIIKNEKREQEQLQQLTQSASADIDLLESVRPRIEAMIASSRSECEVTSDDCVPNIVNSQVKTEDQKQ